MAGAADCVTSKHCNKANTSQQAFFSWQIFKGSFGKVNCITVPNLVFILMHSLAASICLQVRPKKQHSSDGWWNKPADELNPIPIPYPPRQRSPAPPEISEQQGPQLACG